MISTDRLDLANCRDLGWRVYHYLLHEDNGDPTERTRWLTQLAPQEQPSCKS